jgi:hypothetical protein
MMTFGMNRAAVDSVHAILMGLTPERIPLIRETFMPYRYPLTDFPRRTSSFMCTACLCNAANLLLGTARNFVYRPDGVCVSVERLRFQRQ